MCKITEQATWLKGLNQQMFLRLTGLGLGYQGLMCIPNTGNYPFYSYHNNLSGALYSLISFKCMCIATNHQADDPPKTGMLKRNEENDQPDILSLKF